jgi:hypothetical protein
MWDWWVEKKDEQGYKVENNEKWEKWRRSRVRKIVWWQDKSEKDENDEKGYRVKLIRRMKGWEGLV